MPKSSDYDFLGSIYKNTKPSELEECFESICKQTLKPKNIFLVLDGFIQEDLKNIVKEYTKLIPIKTIPLNKNVGLGIALRKGLNKCQSEIILRFDTDDINHKRRAEYIVNELKKGDIDIVGSNLFEFVDDPQKPIYRKKMPLTHDSIRRILIFRNPINHPSVGFLRQSILKVQGGYRHIPFYEDYDLWVRAMAYGLKFKNIDKELVYVRIKEQRGRRKGFNLINSLLKLASTFFKISILYGILFIPFLFLRIICALLPLKIIKLIYEKLFRSKIIN